MKPGESKNLTRFGVGLLICQGLPRSQREHVSVAPKTRIAPKPQGGCGMFLSKWDCLKKRGKAPYHGLIPGLWFLGTPKGNPTKGEGALSCLAGKPKGQTAVRLSPLLMACFVSLQDHLWRLWVRDEGVKHLDKLGQTKQRA